MEKAKETNYRSYTRFTFFTSSVNGIRMLIKTSLGPRIVFLYPVKKSSSRFTFLVFPFAEKKENAKENDQLEVNSVSIPR